MSGAQVSTTSGGHFASSRPSPPTKKNELGIVNEMLMMFMLGLPH